MVNITRFTQRLTQAKQPAAKGKATLARGSQTMRQQDAAAHGRGHQGPSGEPTPPQGPLGRLKTLVEGTRLAVQGTASAALYAQISRSGVGGATMEHADQKLLQSQAKADDGRSLILQALRGKPVSAATTARLAATAAKGQAAKARKEASQGAKQARSDARLKRYDEYGS